MLLGCTNAICTQAAYRSRQHENAAVSVTASQLHGCSLNPDPWLHLDGVSVSVLPMSTWVSSKLSGLLSPPKNMLVGVLAPLNY